MSSNKMEVVVSVTSSSEFRSYVDSTSKQHRKTRWRTYRYFIDFESRINIKLSMSSRSNPFDVDSPFSHSLLMCNFYVEPMTNRRWCVYWVLSYFLKDLAYTFVLNEKKTIYHIKVGLSLSKKNCVTCFIERPLKMTKMPFILS